MGRSGHAHERAAGAAPAALPARISRPLPSDRRSPSGGAALARAPRSMPCPPSVADDDVEDSVEAAVELGRSPNAGTRRGPTSARGAGRTSHASVGVTRRQELPSCLPSSSVWTSVDRVRSTARPAARVGAVAEAVLIDQQLRPRSTAAVSTAASRRCCAPTPTTATTNNAEHAELAESLTDLRVPRVPRCPLWLSPSLMRQTIPQKRTVGVTCAAPCTSSHWPRS